MSLNVFYWILGILMIGQIMIIGVWRTTCFFKKKCHWKSCPYRRRFFQAHLFGTYPEYCRKYPPTQQEIDDYNQCLDKILDELQSNRGD